MDYSVLQKGALFQGMSEKQIQNHLEMATYSIKQYEKGQTIFFLMDRAARVGIILQGHVQAQKAFPNGSQVNVSLLGPGDIIGAAAAFSSGRRYPCDIMAVEPVTVMMFQRENLLSLMQRDSRILENLLTEIASTTFMLQQRLELFSYSGIAQKAAFWLLTQARQSGKNQITIPESVSRWALMLNVSRPSLHRELKKLEEKGLITYRPPVIQINDSDCLQEILS